MLRLTDAAGNVSTGDPFVVDAGGALNGSFAHAGAAGTPIAGATIQVLDRELRTGTRFRSGSSSRPTRTVASVSCRVVVRRG